MSAMTDRTTLRALSIRQPWAWLVANGHKRVENRTWPTEHRGDTLIHAGKLFDTEGHQWVLRSFPHLRDVMPQQFDLGGVVGIGQVVNCVDRSSDPWFVGPYGFVFLNPRPLRFVPVRGELGFFRVPITDALHTALRADPADHGNHHQSGLFA